MKLADMILFPPRCVICRTFLPAASEAALCSACVALVRQKYRKPYCFPIEGADWAGAPLLYAGHIATLMKRYKFYHDKSAGRWFAAQTAGFLAQEIAQWHPDLITFIPVSFERMWVRGYDQSEMIARYVGKQLGIPCIRCLKKRSFCGRQSSRTAEQRQNAVRDTFSVCHSPVGKRIILLDDVITTGATMTEGIRVLREQGAEAVFAVGVAKTAKDNTMTDFSKKVGRNSDKYPLNYLKKSL